ncbi:MAG: HAMP domain-containing protein [Candidatus Eisenbacteria bacterium]
MQRSGPSIEVKIVILVAAVVVIQDLVLLAMFLSGAAPVAIQATLGGLLVLAVTLAAVWGNAIARALRRLTRACFVAQEGDVRVLTEPDRTDEIGELNDEINRLVLSLRALSGVEAELSIASGVTDTASDAAPDALHSAHEVLVSIKELKEGASAEGAILRRVAGSLGEARTLLGQVAGRVEGGLKADDMAARLNALKAGAREVELLSDSVVDEAARAEIDEASLARSVNGLRETVRTMADVAGEAARLLDQRTADARAAGIALERIGEADVARSDASRVAELMDSSAARGFNEAARLAAGLRKLGLALEAYDQRRKLMR